MGDHTIKETARKSRWGEAWLWRKLAYGVLTVIVLVAVGFGLVSPEQSDLWLQNSDKVLGIITALALGVATAKTTAASDVDVTEVERARAELEAARLTPSRIDDLIAQVKLTRAEMQAAKASSGSSAELSASPRVETAPTTSETDGDQEKPFSVYH